MVTANLSYFLLVSLLLFSLEFACVDNSMNKSTRIDDNWISTNASKRFSTQFSALQMNFHVFLLLI